MKTRSRADERGAALVELALVVPILFGLVFGMIDFGINLSNQISTRQGVRESAREAVVMTDDADDIASIVALTKSRIGVKTSETKVRVLATPTDEGAVGEPLSQLTVCASVPLDSVTGLYSAWLDGRYLQSKVTMRVEQPLDWTDSGSAGGDAAPADADWAWCAVDA